MREELAEALHLTANQIRSPVRRPAPAITGTVDGNSPGDVSTETVATNELFTGLNEAPALQSTTTGTSPASNSNDPKFNLHPKHFSSGSKTTLMPSSLTLWCSSV